MRTVLILVVSMTFHGFALTPRAGAATYYVAPGGSDSATGTSTASPFKTVAHAVNKMLAGDTTYVRGGTYTETGITFRRSGTQSAPIRLLNYPGESPVITFVDARKVQRITLQSAAGYTKPIGWIVIEGFEIRGGYDGLKLYTVHDTIIRRNYIHHSLSQGILGGGTRILIDRNRIEHNGNFVGCANGQLTKIGTSICNQMHGAYLHGTALTITNNIFNSNLAFGIQVNGSSSTYDPAKHPGREFAGASGWLIANNTFAYQAYRAGITLWGNVEDMTIENNIFYENGVTLESSRVQGVNIGARVKNASIRNNVAYASGSGAAVFLQPERTSANYTQSGNIIANPLFVNAPATLPTLPNFALTASSPAINRGLTIAASRVSINDVSRADGAFDIGAYEYGAGTSARRTPKAPVGFRVR